MPKPPKKPLPAGKSPAAFPAAGDLFPVSPGATIDPPSAPTALPPTCADCQFWGPLPDGSGECRATPPDVPAGLPYLVGTAPLFVYRRTADSTPACGSFAAKS